MPVYYQLINCDLIQKSCYLLWAADGYSIYINGLPMTATESLLEVFEKFGVIKKDGIQVRSNRVRISWHALY